MLVGATVAQAFVFNVFVGVVMGLQKFYLVARLGILFTVARGVLMFALLKAGFGLLTLAFVQFASTLVSNLLVYQIARQELPYVSIRLVRPTRVEALKLFNYGKYVLVSNIGDKLVFATDAIVIGIFQPISALTYYAIGGTLIEQFRTFVASMGAILNPLSSDLEARKQSRGLATGGAHRHQGGDADRIAGLHRLHRSRPPLHQPLDGPGIRAQAGTILAVLATGHLFGLPYYTISGGPLRSRTASRRRLVARLRGCREPGAERDPGPALRRGRRRHRHDRAAHHRRRRGAAQGPAAMGSNESR